jgi:8-oxo-dGTP diphosphatase
VQRGPGTQVAVAVDVVVLTLAPDGGDHGLPPLTPLALAVRRDRDPFAGSWALPGGHVGLDEGLEAAVCRVLGEAGGPPSPGPRLTAPRHLEQLATFGAPGRDPRGRVVSVSYLALLPAPPPVAAGAAWHPALDPPALAFDHRDIVAAAVARLRSKLTYSTVAYGLLGEEFTLSDLQAVYEAVQARPLDKRNFRRKVLALGLLEETGEQRRGSHRPAQLYRFPPDLVVFDDVIA